MKRHIFTFLIISTACFAAQSCDSSYATDKGGCLTCHRYPGLVKFEKPDKTKVLHIDEDKQIASKHGKTDCRQCHPKTAQIPHTDVIDVECTTGCHAEDREKIDATNPASLTEFHKDEKFAITRLDDESSCRVCHPLYPHSKNNRVRAFVNMHTGFMLCEVCHFTREHRQDVIYDWKEPEKFEFIGEPYGTHQKKEVREAETSTGVISKMLRILSDEENATDKTHKTIHLIARIAAYKMIDGKKALFINTQDNDKARVFLDREKGLSQSEREKELNFFHRDIAKKEISVACNECHAPDGIMDYEKLGFSRQKAEDLQYMNIKSLLTKYETFIIPNLFGPGK